MRSGRQKPNYEKVPGKDFIKSFKEKLCVKGCRFSFTQFYF